MNDLIQDELRGVLSDWTGGKQVRSIALGHPVRELKDHNGKVLGEERHTFRQKVALECVFRLIENGLEVEGPIDFAWFHDMAEETGRGMQLSAEETGAAISLAWVALHRGWARALTGHPDHQYISVTREAQA